MGMVEKDRVNVNSFKEVLVADDFGLASLPEEIWRARLAISHSVLNSSLTSVQRRIAFLHRRNSHERY